MKNRIKVDYEKVDMLVKLFPQELDTLRQALSQVENIINGEIQSSWKGVAAAQFFGEWDRIRENLKKLDTGLEIGGQNLEKIRQVFQTAEEKAKGHLHK